MTGCDSNDLTSPLRHTAGLYLAGVTLFAGLTMGAAADYQDTLAARGADAFMPPSERVTLDVQDLEAAFSPESIETDPALSDQEVMIDLHERMAASDQLSDAASNLAPEAPVVPDAPATATAAAAEPTSGDVENTATADAEDASQAAATVAAR